MPPALMALVIASVGVLVGWLCLWRASAASQRAFVRHRAPRLPVDVLADHDDAWIEGTVEADDPLHCPHFETLCVQYHYSVEREVEVQEVHRHGSDSQVRTTTRWESVESKSKSIPFRLATENGHIVIDLPAAKTVETVRESDHGFELRRNAHILPVGAEVTVLGVKLEDGTFGPYRDVPLVVSRRSHATLTAKLDAGEGSRRTAGLVIAAVAMALAVFVYARSLAPGDRLIPALAAAGLAGMTLLGLWSASAYNRFIRWREQCHAAWRQIDVDLAVRNALLPNLSAVIAGYAEHEKSLQADLAQLRSDLDRPDVRSDIESGGRAPERAERRDDTRIETDRVATRAARTYLGLAEKYPDLGADKLFTDLHRRLWALEEKLAASRGFYNGRAKRWNDLVEGFPSSIVARLAGHRVRRYFES